MNRPGSSSAAGVTREFIGMDSPTALRAALKDPVVVQRMTELGAEFVPESKLTPDGLRTWLKQETDRWGPVIKAAGVYAD